jgi:hypothetical protein
VEGNVAITPFYPGAQLALVRGINSFSQIVRPLAAFSCASLAMVNSVCSE